MSDAARMPAQLTSFVGRSRELAELGRLFARARLITLTGPGGSGKTRLALEFVARLPAGPHFVWSSSGEGGGDRPEVRAD